MRGDRKQRREEETMEVDGGSLQVVDHSAVWERCCRVRFEQTAVRIRIAAAWIK